MKTILITGATGGIGLALAHIYHDLGERLVLVGRRPLADLNDPVLTAETYIQADLAEPTAAADTIQAWLDERGLEQMDVLVHNAGLGYFGAIADQPTDNIQLLTNVNLGAPVALSHRLLPHVRRARGKIVFISSVVSSLPAPEYAVYAATKAALDSFAYNLRIEAGDEISVQLIHPGATRTDMHRKAGIPTERMDTSKFPPADTVATQIAVAINGEQDQVAIGTTNKLMRWAGKHAAKLVDTAMKGRA